MTRTRGIFLALAAVLFVIAFGMHTTSLFQAGPLISSTAAIILSAVTISLSIFVWLAAFFMANRVKSEGAGSDEFYALYMLFMLVRASPLWVNLVMLVFIAYLVATSMLVLPGAGDMASRLRIFGAVCSALDLHALLLLGTIDRGAKSEGRPGVTR